MVVHHRCSGCYEAHKRWHKEVEVIGVHLSERMERQEVASILKETKSVCYAMYLCFIG